jgi:alkylation response protein AidB-like acyl-CoA dehydrogenase
MDLSDSEEQSTLRKHLATFFARESSPERVRASEPLGYDPRLWAEMVAMGLPTMAVPEVLGGGGASTQDLTLAAEEFGRRIAAAPFVETAVANDQLARLVQMEPDGPASELLASALEGNIISVAIRPARSGVARLAPAGAIADTLIAFDGDELVAVQLEVGPSAPAVPPLNLGSSPVADCRTDGRNRAVLTNGDVARSMHHHVVAEWQILTASALVGLASTALELAVDYVKQRRAFGVTIGWFQSVQHRLADDATETDGARLLAYEAAWATDEKQANARTLASMAFLFASQTAFKTAGDSLHFHGGYGYTLEYDIQLYFRRAKAWALAAGDPRREFQHLATLLFEREGG